MKNLKTLNTFGIDCTAKEFVEFNSENDFEKMRRCFSKQGRNKKIFEQKNQNANGWHSSES